MSFDPSFLEILRQASSLTAYITGYLGSPNRAGKWRCPFHDEKTPSFSVYEESGRYKCFGCHESGDIISFCMKLDNLSFPEAVKHLAEKFSLDMPEQQGSWKPSSHQRYDEAYTLLNLTCCHFQKALEGPEGADARAYLQKREINKDTIKRFRLGWSSGAVWPSETSPNLLRQTGLVNIETGRPLFFRRLMFPLQDSQGRIIGFGGRVLDQRHPKYLNSPQTPLFSKSLYMYGMYQGISLPELRHKPVVVVEGYMDVLRLVQSSGVRALAALGTAFQATQIEHLWRMDPLPLICMDGDAAGQKATQAIVEAVLPYLKPGFSLRLAQLPPEKDPDNFVASGGSFNLILQKSLSLVDYMRKHYLQYHPEMIPEEKARQRADIYKLLKCIQNPDIRQLYREALWSSSPRQSSGQRLPFSPTLQPLLAPFLGSSSDSPHLLQERILVATGVMYPEFFLEVMEAMALIIPQDSKNSTALWQQTLMEWGNNPEKQTWSEFMQLKGLSSHEIVTEALVRHAPFLKIPTSLAHVRGVWWDIFQHYHLKPLQQRERQEAHHAFLKNPSQITWQRLFLSATKSEKPPFSSDPDLNH